MAARHTDSFSRLLKYFIILILAFLFILTGNGALKAFPSKMPFNQGEKLIYRAKWGFIPAGVAVIEVLPFENVYGIKSYHFVMQTKTTPQIDPLYTIRDRQDSYADAEMTRTLLYTKRSTGKHPRNIRVTFDWKKMTASYVNAGRPEKTVSITPGTFDSLGLIFVIRMHELKYGTVIEIPVTDGKKFVTARATVVRREKTIIGNKSYDTYVVIPDMESLDKVLGKKEEPKVKIWFTADEKKIPVKFQSKVSIGTFVFELISVTF